MEAFIVRKMIQILLLHEMKPAWGIKNYALFLEEYVYSKMSQKLI